MGRIKKVLIIGSIILLAVGIFAGWYILRSWPMRFHAEFDRFFGAENWETISAEEEESIIYTEYVSVRSNPAMSGEVPGKFQNWNIEFTNRDGNQEIWQVSNHTMKINQDKYWILSPKRYSAKQALVQELMEISFEIAGEEVRQEVILDILPEEEADCLDISISYWNGNPKPEFYDALWEESWFTANTVTAKDYLECDLYDFYIDVFAYDYRVEALSKEEQEHLMDSFEAVEQRLRQTYGEDAAYEIYFDEDHAVEQNG